MRIALLTMLLACAFCATPCATFAQDAVKPVAPSVKTAVMRNEQFVDEVIALTNIERSKVHAPPLKRRDELSKAASWLAEDMAVNNYFAHVDRLGRHSADRLPVFGYANFSMMGENICSGQPTPAEALASWMKSPGHRANLLNPDFREIGVACIHAPNNEYQDFWVQDFASQEEVFPLIINMDAPTTKTPDVKLYVYGAQWAQKARFSSDGAHWTDWEPYQPSRDWKLTPILGKQTVYAEISNGTDTKRQTATIELVSANQSATRPDKKKTSQ